MSTHTLSTNNLFLRPGEEYMVFPMNLDQIEYIENYTRVYMLSLIPVPDIPSVDFGLFHSESEPLALVCVEYYPTIASKGVAKYGWVNLGPDEKNLFADLLLSKGAQPGEWWYLFLDTEMHFD